ncbi:MAG: glycosyltransferase [Chloroflexota bacterium]
MPRETAPTEITELADARAVARRAHDWATADQLLARIAAAGWKVVDTGTLYDLERTAPVDRVVDGVVRHGSSESVPSRLEEAPAGLADVVVVAEDDAAALVATVEAVLRTSGPGVRVVVVANAPADDVLAAVDALEAAHPGSVEIVRMATRLGHALVVNAGMRRVVAPVVVLMAAGVAPTGDLPGALAAALSGPEVAVAGPFGLASDDLRRWEPAAGPADAIAVSGRAMAFRRDDINARGPLDEHFAAGIWLDAWWSLVLRDPWAVEEPVHGAPIRHAVVAGTGHVAPAWSDEVPHDAARAKAEKKDFYRFLKRFASRRDLLTSGH